MNREIGVRRLLEALVMLNPDGPRVYHLADDLSCVNRSLTMGRVDEQEQIDVYDAEGNRIVGRKHRSDAHRDGDWHAVSFVWNARLEGKTAWVVMQVRSWSGDPYRGHIDSIACGHVVAGETALQAAVRELAEECGVETDEDLLEAIGVWKVERSGTICRQSIQNHFICRPFIEVADLRPTEEASTFVELRLRDLIGLVTGRMSSVRVNRCVGSLDLTEVTSNAIHKYSETTLQSFERAAHAIGRVLSELD